MIIASSWKNKLLAISRFGRAAVLTLFIIIGVEYVLTFTIGYTFQESQEVLLFSLISFFSLVMAILALNIDLTKKAKWRLLASFIVWSSISFLSGFYASISAVEIIDESVFPIVDFLAKVWKSYLLLFITCVNFISASLLFHRIANAIQVDTIEWFKRGFGNDGDPPKVSLSPVARKILLGLASQLALNLVIMSMGGAEEFFTQISTWMSDLMGFFGVS
ncbi:MAG: hypothetical protein ACTSUE_02230 [Promethearchaeota archaeon]